jgi:hypothetical protein
MKQFEQCRFIRIVSQTMVFTACRFLIFAALQFVVITRYYALLCLAKNKNQRTLNPIQLRFLGLIKKCLAATPGQGVSRI